MKRGNSLGGVPLEGARRERRTSVIDCEALEIAWGSFAGGSEAGTPDELGWIVKRGNSLAGLRWRERDGSVVNGL